MTEHDITMIEREGDDGMVETMVTLPRGDRPGGVSLRLHNVVADLSLHDATEHLWEDVEQARIALTPQNARDIAAQLLRAAEVAEAMT